MNLRAHFRGPSASIDEQIESFAIDRVPAKQRWPIPAISRRWHRSHRSLLRR